MVLTSKAGETGVESRSLPPAYAGFVVASAIALPLLVLTVSTGAVPFRGIVVASPILAILIGVFVGATPRPITVDDARWLAGRPERPGRHQIRARDASTDCARRRSRRGAMAVPTSERRAAP